MPKMIYFAALAAVLVSTAGCQSAQYQAASEPSYSSGGSGTRYYGDTRYSREAQCRDEARRASADAGNTNVGKTASGAVIGGLVGYAVGKNVTHHGHHYTGAGSAVGAATGAAVGHNMGDDPQAVYDAVYEDCMYRR